MTSDFPGQKEVVTRIKTDEEKRKLINEVLDAKCDSVLTLKNPGYSKGGLTNDNFWNLAKEFGLSPIQVLGIYWAKHRDSITYYINMDGKVLDPEPIEQRIIDNINYMRLLWTILMEMGRISFPGQKIPLYPAADASQ